MDKKKQNAGGKPAFCLHNIAAREEIDKVV
jgi:hypothetical protein